MASNTPRFLVAELRSAFRQCARPSKKNTYCRSAADSSRQFQTAHARHARRARSGPTTTQQQSHSQSQDPRSPPNPSSDALSTQTSDSRKLVPLDQHGRAVGGRRTTDAPMKIIPKADITPSLQLSPKERLHIEILTRRPPPQIKQIKPYRERLLIYHHGNLTNNALVFLKVLGLVCASTVTAVFVPAHYFAGTAPWICGSCMCTLKSLRFLTDNLFLVLLSGWIPAILFHRLLKPLVSRVYLRLPPNARASPDAAMKYAKNLPSSAQVDVDFTRMTALPGTISINVADLQQIRLTSRWPWQVANFKWVGTQVERGSFFRRNPTEFYMKPETGAGMAKRDVIPGIWPEVYKRLTGTAKEPVSRWRRT